MNLRLYVESVQTVPKLIHFSLEGIIFVAWTACSPDLFLSMTAELSGTAWYGKEMSAVAVVFLS